VSATRERAHQGAFTLLELLVSMAIFGIIGALAMGGLNAVMRQETVAREQLKRLHDVQRAVRVITSDFAQLNPRIVRDPLGTSEPPLLAPCDITRLVCLSHDGWRNPFNQFNRGTLQRTQYRIEDDKLIREHFRVMDRTLTNEPRAEVLLDRVESLELSFPPATTGGNEDWTTQWPVLKQSGAAGAAEAGLPRAVRIKLRLKDWGEIDRIVEVVR
jgi:general secretion pathway protein J